jgi:hypothetical protein
MFQPHFAREYQARRVCRAYARWVNPRSSSTHAARFSDNADLTGLHALIAVIGWAVVFALASIVFGVMALWLRSKHLERSFVASDFVPHTLASLLCFAGVACFALVGLWLLPPTARVFLDENAWLLVLVPPPVWWSGFAFLRARGQKALTLDSGQ